MGKPQAPALEPLLSGANNLDAYTISFKARHDHIFHHETLKTILRDTEYEATREINVSVLAEMYQPAYDYGINGYRLQQLARISNRILDKLNPDVEPATFAAAVAETYGHQITLALDNDDAHPEVAANWMRTLIQLEGDHCLSFAFSEYENDDDINHTWTTKYLRQLKRTRDPAYSTFSYDLQLLYQFTLLEPYLPQASEFWPLMELHKQFLTDWHLHYQEVAK